MILRSLWSNHHNHSVTHRSFRHASPHLWNQLPTSLWIPHPNYSCPSQRPSFEYAGLTCYTLLSPFHHFFTVSLWDQNLPFQKILSSTEVCFCLSGWSYGCRRFYFFSVYLFLRAATFGCTKRVWLINWLVVDSAPRPPWKRPRGQPRQNLAVV